jgi:hypothetical protein
MGLFPKTTGENQGSVKKLRREGTRDKCFLFLFDKY